MFKSLLSAAVSTVGDVVSLGMSNAISGGVVTSNLGKSVAKGIADGATNATLQDFIVKKVLEEVGESIATGKPMHVPKIIQPEVKDPVGEFISDKISDAIFPRVNLINYEEKKEERDEQLDAMLNEFMAYREQRIKDEQEKEEEVNNIRTTSIPHWASMPWGSNQYCEHWTPENHATLRQNVIVR